MLRRPTSQIKTLGALREAGYQPRSIKTEVRANLLTQAGEPITTQDGSRLVTVYQTSNSVGEDTDVREDQS